MCSSITFFPNLQQNLSKILKNNNRYRWTTLSKRRFKRTDAILSENAVTILECYSNFVAYAKKVFLKGDVNMYILKSLSLISSLRLELFMRYAFFLKFQPDEPFRSSVMAPLWHPTPQNQFKVQIRQSANYLDHSRNNLPQKVFFIPYSLHVQRCRVSKRCLPVKWNKLLRPSQPFFEVLSSGVLLPIGEGIKDPVETDQDMRTHISHQDAEDVTFSAMTALRHAAIGDYHSVFNEAWWPCVGIYGRG